jgi:uncharacterized repeat protein (TIGR01451 family)
LVVVAGLVGVLSTVLQAFPVGGRAYGVFIDNLALPLSAPVNFGPTPLAQQPPGGGTDSASAGSISVSGGLLNLTSILTTGPATVTTTGNPATNTSSSTATVSDVALLTNLFGAGSISSSCSLTPSGFEGTTSFGSPTSSLVGFPTGAFTNPAPNTLLTITGLGSVILNEQTYSNVAGMRVFEVNALRITLDTGLLLGATGSVTIAHAECSGSLPTVTSVAPPSGPTGTALTITGANYLSPATVTIGGLPATGVTVVNATTITATAPAFLPQGAWDVTVTTPIGSGTLVGGFTSTNTNPPVPVGGSAFGTQLSLLDALVAFLSLGPTPTVNIPVSTTPDDQSATGGTVNVPGILPLPTPFLNAGAFTVHTVTDPIAGTVTSTAISSGANIGGGLLSTTDINSTCNFGPAGFTGSARVDGLSSTLLGDLPNLVDPPPNFGLNLLGLGQVTLNEQTDVTAAGVRTFTVNAIHLDVAPLGLSLGSLILGQTTCATVVPTALSLTPTTGTSSGGTSVTITGTNFALPATVTFGGVPAASVTVNGATEIIAVTPPHVPGNVPVVVGTPAGSASVPGGFTFVDLGGPTATSMTPTTGPTLGGTVVTITGTNFANPASVTFDGLAGTSLTVDSQTQITVTTPAHVAGVAAVVVTTLAGTATVPGGFLYVPPTPGPTATSMLPTSGPTAGGTVTVISGGNFTGASSVTFGGVAAASFTVDNAGQITATTPAHAAGNVAVVITTPGGTASVPGGFTFTASPGTPTASSIVPATGPTAGGTVTVITGTNFTGATSVTFDGLAATTFTVDTPTQITATTPAHGQANVAVVVTTPGGTATVPGGFSYVAGGGAPTALSIAPASGTTAGGTVTTITGTNFTGATSVTFDGLTASFIVSNATQITAITPAHVAIGNVAVVITTPGGTASVPGGFTYTAAASPNLTVTVSSPPSISPGATLVYTVHLTNTGGAAANGAIFTAPILPGLTGPTVSGGLCALSPCVLNLPASASTDILASYTLPASYAGANPISATFSATIAGDPTPADNTVTVNTPVVPLSDIALLMTVDNPTAPVGQLVTFTVTATNTGPANATGIEVIDKLPVGLTLVDATLSQGTYDPDTGRWSVGALLVGETANLLLTGRVDIVGLVTNTATRTGGDQIDPDSSDNIAAVTLTGLPTADIRVSMTANATSVPFGSPVTFTITVSNVGPSTAHGLVVTDLLPASLIFNTYASNLGTYSSGTGIWNIGTLPVGTDAVLLIAATVNATGPITNKADKTAQTEPDPAPNTDHASVTLNGTGADLQLVMTSNPAPAPPGATVTVDLTLTNLGPDAATGVGVTVAMPGGLIFVSATPEQGSYNAGTNFWTVGNMPASGPDGEARLRIVGIVPGGGVTSTSPTAGGDQADPNLLNNNPGPLPPSTGPVDLAASISMTGSLLAAGNPVSFTIGITNVGTGPSVGAIDFRLALPANITATTPPPGWGCTQIAQVYACTRADLAIAPGQQVTAVVGAVVTLAGVNSVPITVTVLYPPDVNLANNVASVPVPPGGDTADLVVTQTAAEAPPGTLTYHVTVTNNGPTIATGVTLTDDFPSALALQSTAPPSVTCTGTTTIVCTVGTLAAGASTQVNLVGTTSQTGPVTNIAVATSGVTDPNTANNISSLTTTVQGNSQPTCAGDSDCDGMTDTCELQFGLNPNFNDAALDPDGDGLTNLQECTDGTHPRGFYKQIYAEGATGSFFNTEFSLVNTDPTHEGKVLMRMLLSNGQVASKYLTLAALHRVVVNASELLGSNSYEFSTTIEADVPVASARAMTWDPTYYGMSLGTGSAAASTTWYFAEGSTLGDFHLFFLLVNPSETTDATVTATYLLLDGSTVVRQVLVPAHSRVTVAVKAIPGLNDADVGAVFTSTLPIVVERSMYLNHGRVFEAGDAVAGVPQPMNNWFIAEGASSAFFNYFLLLANPGPQATTVTARYQLEDGTTVTKLYTLPPTSRKTLNVGLEDPKLATAAVSTSLTATNPIIAERAMWWPGPSLAPRWYGGHQTMGSTQSGLRWAMASGSDGGAGHDKTYVLIANQNSTAAQALVTVIFDDATSVTKLLSLAATSRTTVNIGEIPGAANRRFSVIVESVGPSPVPLSVDVSRYHTTPEQFWSGGGSTLGIKVP